MTVYGIIAEYNPLHRGHVHQIATLRAHDPGAGIVVALSGHFTQRGDAAVLDKWTRARLAVRHGANLVVELPTAFAVRSAEHFATGGVRLLAGLGIIDRLAFGSELADGGALCAIADAMLSADTEARLRDELKRGTAYAAAITNALPPTIATNWANALRLPNTILAVEYVKAVRRYAPHLTPLPMARVGSAYHDATLHGNAPSATAIRAALTRADATAKDAPWQSAVPTDAVPMLADAVRGGLPQTERLFLPLMHALMLAGDASLAATYGIGEGLEHRFRAASRTATSLDDFCHQVYSKRYPLARIRRSCLHILLRLTKAQCAAFDAAGPLAARVLACDARGRALLRESKRRGTIPAITKLDARAITQATDNAPYANAPNTQNTTLDISQVSTRDMLQNAMLALDVRATDIWGLTHPARRPAGADFVTSPAIFDTNCNANADASKTVNTK